MNLKVGIVGLPNAGKSTLFNALLKRQVAEAANYPFTTIEPNIGVVPVPDERLEVLAEIVAKTEGDPSASLGMTKKPPLVPAIVEFVDIAGLVKGASEGQGLGNKFLSHIREVDLICNVVREFPDPDVVHVAGSVDPQRDREIIETELMLADLQTLEKQAEPRGVKDKVGQEHWMLIKKLQEGLNHGISAREVIVDTQDQKKVADLHLLSMKPVLYVANVSEQQLTNLQSDKLTISAKIESELSSLPEEDQKAYLKELGLAASGLDRLIQKAYEMLGLISFLTCGVKEVRAWTIEKGMKAPQAAGVIHTDFEKKFIKADVISYHEFIAVGGWKKAREAGKVRSEGKGYEIRDGDVIEYKIGS
ncbi:redox-regulated ATPase YchF [Candidatus Gottesmanbacteria bacterium]|nr:redox-regulated ATPase YchF [Candidatus Gottesmanbacteria bacterium]